MCGPGGSSFVLLGGTFSFSFSSFFFFFRIFRATGQGDPSFAGWSYISPGLIFHLTLAGLVEGNTFYPDLLFLGLLSPLPSLLLSSPPPPGAPTRDTLTVRPASLAPPPHLVVLGSSHLLSAQKAVYWQAPAVGSAHCPSLPAPAWPKMLLATMTLGPHAPCTDRW